MPRPRGSVHLSWLYLQRQTGANKYTPQCAPGPLLYTSVDVQIYRVPHRIHFCSLCSVSCTNTWCLRCQKNKHYHSGLGNESEIVSGTERLGCENLNILETHFEYYSDKTYTFKGLANLLNIYVESLSGASKRQDYFFVFGKYFDKNYISFSHLIIVDFILV